MHDCTNDLKEKTSCDSNSVLHRGFVIQSVPCYLRTRLPQLSYMYRIYTQCRAHANLNYLPGSTPVLAG